MSGVAVPGRGGWDTATAGSPAYVSLGVVHESARLWPAADGRSWTEIQPLCSIDAAVRLSTTRPACLQGLCSSNPGRGFMDKLLVESADGGAPVVLGQAPAAGITTGFAMTSSGTAVVAFLASEEASFVTGSYYTVDGGYTAQ